MSIFKSHFVYPENNAESRWYPIFCVTKGVAVGNYSFTLGRLEAGAPSTFDHFEFGNR